MTDAQFKTLKAGDVIENELGWQYAVVKPCEGGWALKSIPNTGREQHLRGSSTKGRVSAPSAWVLVR